MSGPELATVESHRLQLVTDLDVPVKLDAGRFKMRRNEAADGRATMVRWYTAHAQPWLAAHGSWSGAIVWLASTAVAFKEAFGPSIAALDL